MYLEGYPYEIYENLFGYVFYSIGPMGSIKKVVRFVPITRSTYNLVFGDYDELTSRINDTAITNNNDRKKVLVTVASIVHDFTFIFPDIRIFAKGSTHSRTRLYRMGINNNWDLISSEMVVYGYRNRKWEFFEPGMDYGAFLVHRN